MVAPTPVALMRSRYSAYVQCRTDYLLQTWHASTRPPSLAIDDPAPRWLGLTIRDALAADDDHASVEFVARYRIGGRVNRLHEHSRFVREAGRWYYIDGVIDPPTGGG